MDFLRIVDDLAEPCLSMEVTEHWESNYIFKQQVLSQSCFPNDIPYHFTDYANVLLSLKATLGNLTLMLRQWTRRQDVTDASLW